MSLFIDGTQIWELAFKNGNTSVDLLELAIKPSSTSNEIIVWQNPLIYTQRTDNTSYVVKARDKTDLPNKLSIPSTFNGLSVTQIDVSAFKDCSKLSIISLPNTIQTIHAFAFNNCANLESITLPANSTLKEAAFRECNKLTKVTINTNTAAGAAGVIGPHAFRDCSLLSTVELGNNILTIDVGAFHSCSNIKELTVPATVTYVGSFGLALAADAKIYCESPSTMEASWDTHWKGDNNPTIYWLGDYTVKLEYTPGSLYSISANSNELAGSILIPDKVGSKVISKIADNGFNNCTNITAVTLPSGIRIIGKNAFEACTALTSCNIPEGVTDIPGYAFNDCESLQALQLPSTLKSIGNTTFADCNSLTEVTIPDNVTSIGMQAFYTNEKLAVVNFSTNSKLTSLGYRAFSYCPISTIYIPKGVPAINRETFMHCRKLQSVIFAEGSQVTSIGAEAFIGCSNLTSLELPRSVTEIGQEAFHVCSKLTTIGGIPSNLTKLGPTAFSDCVALTDSIVIPDAVTEIPSCCFERCTNIPSITIGSKVTKIGYQAFNKCTSLTSFYIPRSVTTIEQGVFRESYNLKNIYYYGTQDQWNNIDIDLSNNDILNPSSSYYANIHYCKQFTINGATYYAFSNMTWREWLADRMLNTAGFYIEDGTNLIRSGSGGVLQHSNNNITVDPSSTVLAFGTYTL